MGGNRQSALMLGINVKRTRFLAHLICGLLAGIGGYVYFLHVGSGAASHATGMEMNAIASSIIGGTLLTGGVGNIIGTFFGDVTEYNSEYCIFCRTGSGMVDRNYSCSYVVSLPVSYTHLTLPTNREV